MTLDTTCPIASKTETDHFVIDLQTDPLSLKHACRNTGWCTKHIFSATSYCLMGPLWTIRRRGKNRPSYLFWKNQRTDLLSFSYDFRHRLNNVVDPITFVAEHPELRHWFATAVSTDYLPVFDATPLRAVMQAEGQVEVDNADTRMGRDIARWRLGQLVEGFVEHGNPFPEPQQAMNLFNEMTARREEQMHALERPCVPPPVLPEFPSLPDEVRGVPHPSYHHDSPIRRDFPPNPTAEHAQRVAQRQACAAEFLRESYEAAGLTGRRRFRTRRGERPVEIRTGRTDAGDAVSRFVTDFAGNPRETRRAELRLFNDIMEELVAGDAPVRPARDPFKRWTDTDRLFFRVQTAWWWLAGCQVATLAYAVTTGLGYG